MCRIQYNNLIQQKHNDLISKKIKKIPAGSGVFIKWYDVKTHQIVFVHGILIAKRGKGFSSHIIIRRKITKEVVTSFFYLYTNTFLGIGLLGRQKRRIKAKNYNQMLKPIRWKYL